VEGAQEGFVLHYGRWASSHTTCFGGRVMLVDAQAVRTRWVSSFKIDYGNGEHWSSPVVSGGVLYLAPRQRRRGVCDWCGSERCFPGGRLCSAAPAKRRSHEDDVQGRRLSVSQQALRRAVVQTKERRRK
jgi:hypothetical protein